MEMPPHWGNDDWPPFAHFGEIGYLMPVRAPSDGIRNVIEEFEAAYETGGFWMPVLHPFLTSQFGIRNVSSTAKEGYEAAREMGSDTLSVRQIRKLGIDATLERVPAGVDYYLSIDIDGFDPSIAPGTGTPSHGGFLYYEVLELLSGLARRGRIVGVDLVEVSPDHDPAGVTSILAAQVLLNLIGRIGKAR